MKEVEIVKELFKDEDFITFLEERIKMDTVKVLVYKYNQYRNVIAIRIFNNNDKNLYKFFTHDIIEIVNLNNWELYKLIDILPYFKIYIRVQNISKL